MRINGINEDIRKKVEDKCALYRKCTYVRRVCGCVKRCIIQRISIYIFLPTGVSGPSFNLMTISVWPSIRKRGGLFLAEQLAKRQANTKASHSDLNLRLL